MDPHLQQMEISLVNQGYFPGSPATGKRIQALRDRQAPVTAPQNQQFWHNPVSFYRAQDQLTSS
jgi:hypothetical protein